MFYQMSLFIQFGPCFAEVKKGNWPYLLNRANILIKICIHIDTDKI